MTDTILASPFSLLKKRNNAMEEDEMTTDTSSFMQSHKRQRGESPPAKSFFQTGRDAENFSPQAGFNVAQLPRSNTAFASALVSQNYIDHLVKSQESQTATLKAEHQKAVEHKDREIAQLKALNQKLLHDLQKGMNESQHVNEENKVLKKAVQIQDAKQKDLLQQNEQYQHIIRLATEHIQNLESANRNLRQELELTRHGNSFGHFPPPDVY